MTRLVSNSARSSISVMPRVFLRVRYALLLLTLGLAALTGCGSGIHDPNFDPNNPGGTTAPTPPTTYSNNWELTTAATTKPSSGPLTKLTGSIISNTASGAAANSITAVFRATSGCYTGANIVPMAGTLSGTAFSARSFDVNAQFLTLTSTYSSTANSMTGTYNIGGGCADGEAGSVSGNRYAALTGTYTGSFTDSGTTHNVSLVLTQSATPTGDGSFLVTGTGSLTNFTCFTSGAIAASSNISGGDANLALSLTGPSNTAAQFTGRLSTDATMLTVNKLAITGSGCIGNFSGVVLKKQ